MENKDVKIKGMDIEINGIPYDLRLQEVQGQEPKVRIYKNFSWEQTLEKDFDEDSKILVLLKALELMNENKGVDQHDSIPNR
ncbi:hypothetical protein H0243_14090 [Staphylococcus sciuri]|uniref:hypothetical protein n=1 Tax=Mammaliicoccus sciuri TaxID=1296 RepID=UPI0018C998A0|nr:hypothetical protein [Mammaliicoccus sciuri]MBG9206920.1 hypothetical protein [Mammaliicoccus sciuri]